jgi:hypothetical protein
LPLSIDTCSGSLEALLPPAPALLAPASAAVFDDPAEPLSSLHAASPALMQIKASAETDLEQPKTLRLHRMPTPDIRRVDHVD